MSRTSLLLSAMKIPFILQLELQRNSRPGHLIRTATRCSPRTKAGISLSSPQKDHSIVDLGQPSKQLSFTLQESPSYFTVCFSSLQVFPNPAPGSHQKSHTVFSAALRQYGSVQKTTFCIVISLPLPSSSLQAAAPPQEYS